MRYLISCVAVAVLAMSGAAAVAQEAAYTVDEQGVISAPDGLQWYVGPGDVTWDQAAAYCQGLDVDGGGWRMPTMAELQALFTGEENREAYNSLPPVFGAKELGFDWAWAAETRGADEAGSVYFYNGLISWNEKSYMGGFFRVLAVRGP